MKLKKMSWKKANERRCLLIDKTWKRGGLTTKEAEELEALQQLADERVERLTPRYPEFLIRKECEL